ncbi:MAG: hypothetical protein KBD00_01840 [Candidatus Peribacteraceae bacterium]|nr:hypothetical protein [Candidatus Peribacteraceae bacterium]
MSQKDDESPATRGDLAAMRTDMQDMMKVFMSAIGGLETRMDRFEMRMDSMEVKMDGMATKDDLENVKHQLLLSDEQTRRDIADMYQDQLSTHDDRITKLEMVTGLKVG